MNMDSKRIDELEKRVEKLEQLLTTPGTTARPKRMSAKEFLLTKGAETEVQKVLALGYFLERMEGMESFNVVDLESAFRAAKEKLPKNLNDAANRNVARGFLMEAEVKKDSKKAWYLTSTGERHVENELNLTSY